MQFLDRLIDLLSGLSRFTAFWFLAPLLTLLMAEIGVSLLPNSVLALFFPVQTPSSGGKYIPIPEQYLFLMFVSVPVATIFWLPAFAIFKVMTRWLRWPPQLCVILVAAPCWIVVSTAYQAMITGAGILGLFIYPALATWFWRRPVSV